MIKVNDGKVSAAGSGKELLTDFGCISIALLDAFAESENGKDHLNDFATDLLEALVKAAVVIEWKNDCKIRFKKGIRQLYSETKEEFEDIKNSHEEVANLAKAIDALEKVINELKKEDD